ncbi:Legumaturain, partial [Operophtera brumata]
MKKPAAVATDKTVENGDADYEFTCQHGPAECYGNKLHACAIDVLQNITAAIRYNSCLMDYSQAGNGSDDVAANVAIKQCAKGAKGPELLKFYGEESTKSGFTSVPYVLINGAPGRVDHFKEDVCKAFSKPPPPCKQ